MVENKQKTPKIDDFSSFSNDLRELKQQVQTFTEQFAVPPEETQPITTPSAVTLGGTKEVGVFKISPSRVEQFLFKHPVIPRGIEIKANRITGRGFQILPGQPDNKLSVEMADEMIELFDRSEDEIRINMWIQDTLAFGNGYLTLVPNQKGTKIVRLNQEHPVFFRVARDKKITQKSKTITSIYALQTEPRDGEDFADEFNGPLKIDASTRKAAFFTQVVKDDQKGGFVPIGEEIPANSVSHLIFDKWGDEAIGISQIQYVHMVITWILNIEDGAAEAMFRSGHTQKKVTTEIRTEKELKKLARNLKNLSAHDTIVLPKGTDVTNLAPTPSDFPRFHDVFLNLLSIRLGIPKPILTLDGTDVNKATMDVLIKDMIADLRADELKVKRTIEHQIFSPACKLQFEDKFTNDKEFYAALPIFSFNLVEETKDDMAARNDLKATTIQKLAQSAQTFTALGQTEGAEALLKYAISLLPPVEENVEKVEIIEIEATNESDQDNREIPEEKPATEKTSDNE